MRTIAAFAVVLFAFAALPAASMTMDSLLQGDLGTLSLRAEANWDGSAWLYEYTLGCDSIGNRMVHIFTLDNPNGSEYFDAANDSGFTNPAWPGLTIPEWRDVAAGLAQGETATFSFRSLYEPAPTPVFVVVVNGGTAAWGETLGMSDRHPGSNPVIPEPGSLLLAATGLVATTAVRPFIRRKKD